ncbi:hypothetical protein G5B40_19330 [Pikeienuella piscinae]|uniref:EF-hand domain-containing protein n=1 Tax=Pikeienuella piscinae TaxID=2748098 RepID=A0A7M3T5X7_9RHOB|nr:hypothetical protein [Pikeienuella piscinae]QIE57408.1 hypothetical protein G5B40_19330 [Pikeienuella piscinae]
MEILEGAAAFAVVMIVLSTIVTGIAEAFLRLLAVRQIVLADAIERLIVDEIVPSVKTELAGVLDADGDGRLSTADVDMLKDKLSLSPLTAKAAKIPFASMRFGHEKITTYSLLQRLAKSELGDALAKYGRSELREKLTDIARTYERYAAAAAERFRYKAHRYTAIAAVLFAFGANVDAGRVFVYLMDDPGARQTLFARAEAAKVENDAAVARLKAAQTGVEEATLDEVSESIEGLSDSLVAFRTDVRLPIGPSYYPYCGSGLAELTIFGWKLDGVFAATGCAGNVDRSYFGWAAYTLLAGVLIGLGGPFWYRVYASLSRVISVARSVGVGGETIDEKSADQPASHKALTQEDIVTTFQVARAGRT